MTGLSSSVLLLPPLGEGWDGGIGAQIERRGGPPPAPPPTPERGGRNTR
jgi:hypothetical protein